MQKTPPTTGALSQPTSSQQTGSQRPVKVPLLHHVNLKTIRMREMVDWYGKVIGSKQNFQDSVMAFLTNDSANHRIALITSPRLTDDPARESHIGMHHTAFEYASIDDLLETWVRLDEEGIVPHMCLDHGFTMSLYYVDPDGNSVELQADWFGDWAKSTAFVQTSPEFAKGPIGRFVDAAKMVAARAAGTDLQELHRMAYSGGLEPEKTPDIRIAM